MSSRDELPILGVVTLNYLREPGLLQMMQDVRVAVFAPADSCLHRIADFSCPMPGLNVDDSVLENAVDTALNRGIDLKGLMSWRDFNVPGVAKVAANHSWLGIHPEALKYISDKASFRQWINENLSSEHHTPVHYHLLPRGCDFAEFRDRLMDLLKYGSAILKPNRGSCSYYISGSRPSLILKRPGSSF